MSECCPLARADVFRLLPVVFVRLRVCLSQPRADVFRLLPVVFVRLRVCLGVALNLSQIRVRAQSKIFSFFSDLELSFSYTLKTHYGLVPLKGPLKTLLDQRSFGAFCTSRDDGARRSMERTSPPAPPKINVE